MQIADLQRQNAKLQCFFEQLKPRDARSRFSKLTRPQRHTHCFTFFSCVRLYFSSHAYCVVRAGALLLLVSRVHRE
jgi:hypothetical protein